jgi:hypothetical protein
MRFVRAVPGNEGGPPPSPNVVLIAFFGREPGSPKPARLMDFPVLFCYMARHGGVGAYANATMQSREPNWQKEQACRFSSVTTMSTRPSKC